MTSYELSQAVIAGFAIPGMGIAGWPGGTRPTPGPRGTSVITVTLRRTSVSVVTELRTSTATVTLRRTSVAVVNPPGES